VRFYNIFKLGFNKHNCPKINIFNAHRKKILDEKKSFYRNIFLSQCLFIAILCANISSVLALTRSLLKFEKIGIFDELGVVDADADESSTVSGEVLGMESLHLSRFVLPNLI